MFKQARTHKVYITHNTLRCIELEAGRHPGTESIVQMPGLRIGNTFYFDLAADSGEGKYTPVSCEKEHKYVNHLTQRISELYNFSNGEFTCAQVHRHPDGCMHFSAGDHIPNGILSRKYQGCVCGIYWIDPVFHMQFWYISPDGSETPVPYEVNDDMVHANMPMLDLEQLTAEVEKNEAMVREEGPLPVKSLFAKAHDHSNGLLNEHSDDTDSEMPEGIDSVLEAMRPYRVLIPHQYKDEKYTGILMGYYHPETLTFNIVPSDSVNAPDDTYILGYATTNTDDPLTENYGWLHIIWNEDGAAVRIRDADPDAQVLVDYYDFRMEAFSRNAGIISEKTLAHKCAVIAGLGSGGFKIGLDLVRAGIGRVVAMDTETLQYVNIARHEGGVRDVGRFKTDIFRERAAQINPDCDVHTFNEYIQNVDQDELAELIREGNTVLVCAADNRTCAYCINELADDFHCPMVTAGCGPRASTGELWYYKPDCGMPCYTCTHGEDTGLKMDGSTARRMYYADEEELAKMDFQPGMYTDISFTALTAEKLIMDLLMEKEDGYTEMMLPYIDQCTFLCNYPVSSDANPYMNLFGEQPVPHQMVSCRSEKNPDCPYCSRKNETG